jgi:light-regulated signal transduction histidine kinase (bacteriophytochrome)
VSEHHPRIYSTKRHGTTLTTCDSEPVHTPGCVQAHGVLLVVRPGDLAVLQVSENSGAILGLSPDAILGRSVDSILGEETAQQIRSFVDHESLEGNPMYALTLALPSAPSPLALSLHTLDGQILVELERVDPADEAAPIDYYSLVRRTTTRLELSSTVRELCQVVAEEVRRITGLDRVMVYRFHPDETGEVFAEDRREDMSPWLGLRYPPHDIPRPAREIFKKIWIRPLPDAAGELAEMVPLANPDTGEPLEMTYCALRGASAMYTEYLHNIGVAASLTLSIRRDGELWGLVTGHHATPTRFSSQKRAACELLAQFVSLQLKQAEEREHLAYRVRMEANHHAVLARAAMEGGLATMVDPRPSLLDGIEAGGVAVHHRGRWWRAGVTPTPPQLDEIAAWLRERSPLVRDHRVAFATDRLSAALPSAAAYADVASGLLAVSIARNCRNLILWFRPEVEQTVRWGGNPHDLPTVVGPHGPRLTPRKSFELWREVVRARSAPWKAIEIEGAQKMKMMVMDLAMSRVEQLAERNEALELRNDELSSFAYTAGHDLKEPLRGISRYANLLLEESQEGRAFDEQAKKRVEALLRLTTRMDGLLDALLHFSEVGSPPREMKNEDLGAMVQEAIEMLGARVLESGVEIRIPRPLPTVHCERVRIREVLSNLISNAIKYNDREDRWVEIGFLDAAEPRPASDALEQRPEAAQGQVLLYVRDNGIGIESRHFQQIFKVFKRLHPRDAYGGGAGVGLAIVKKLVVLHGGRTWVDSAPGGGTSFYFTLAASTESS